MADCNPEHDRVHLSVAEIVALAGLERADTAATGREGPWWRWLIVRAGRLRCRVVGFVRRRSTRGWALVAVAPGVALVAVAPPVVGLSAAVVLLLVGATMAASRPRRRRRVVSPSRPDRERPRRDTGGGGPAHLPYW